MDVFVQVNGNAQDEHLDVDIRPSNLLFYAIDIHVSGGRWGRASGGERMDSIININLLWSYNFCKKNVITPRTVQTCSFLIRETTEIISKQMDVYSQKKVYYGTCVHDG